VLHIINFAHGAALMVALYAVYLLKAQLGIDPYLALPIVVPGMFALGYALQRVVINRASHGKDENILLVTLGISIVLENLALMAFKSDTRTIETPYTLTTVAIGPAFIALPKLVAFAGALVASAVLLFIVARTDLGRAIRAVAKEKHGAKLMGIDVDHVYAMSFGIGLACLGAAACFLLPAYYVNPQVGGGFVLVAFTIVVLGGMGSFAGALVGGLLIGVVESLVRPAAGRIAGADRHLRDLHRGAAVPAAGAVRGARMKRDLIQASRSSRCRAALAAGPGLGRLADLRDDGAVRRAAGAGLEHPGRLRRAVLLRPRAVLRHRRVRAWPSRSSAAASTPGWRWCWPWHLPRSSAVVVGALSFRYGLKGSLLRAGDAGLCRGLSHRRAVARLHRRRRGMMVPLRSRWPTCSSARARATSR
jgi:branched-chain amino acid transport system permease protein